MLPYALIIPLFFLIYLYIKNRDAKQFITTIINENSNITIGESSKNDVIVHNENLYKKILDKGELGLAESYMDGDWSSGNLGSLLNN